MKAILILFSLYLFTCVRTAPIADAPHSPGIVSPDTVWIRTVDTVFVKGPVRIVYRDVEKVDAWGWSQSIDLDANRSRVFWEKLQFEGMKYRDSIDAIHLKIDSIR